MAVTWVLMNKFQISDQDVTDPGTSYYGFVNKDDGSHYIMKAVSDGVITNFTYACSLGVYTTNWTAKASLDYYNYTICWNSESLN